MKKLERAAKALHFADAERQGKMPGDGEVPFWKDLPEWSQDTYRRMATVAIRAWKGVS